jgi:hypothetical protein
MEARASSKECKADRLSVFFKEKTPISQKFKSVQIRAELDSA